ncbi:MAG: methyltransferase family protein [Succinivibrionaceae bacterium]
MWWFAVFKSKIVSNIKHKKLVVTGVYSLVRNPMYAAFLWIYFSLMMLICSSIISIVYYYVCWLYLTILIKYTEERWLLAVFGEEYKEYCNNVSRLFPYGKDIIDNIKSKFVKKSN